MEEAIAELKDEFEDWQAEIGNGDRDENDGYDVCNFQIVWQATGNAGV